MAVALVAASCMLRAVVGVAAPMGTDDARHLLNRTGFGASPEEIARYARLDRTTALKRLLAETTTVAVTPIPPVSLEYLPPRRFRDAGEEEKKELQRQQFQAGAQLRAWWLGEMLVTPSPLTERMTLFWHNHFTSSLEKVKSSALMARQNALLRRNALGNFATLLHEVSRDPAMIVYLDGATSKRGQPNENFAREVMELFTLGEGHYSEQDIKEAARAFTGWSIEPETGEYKWRPLIHDDEMKTVLGTSGRLDGDQVLDILLQQPATADFVVTKLWREFVSPRPDLRQVKRIGDRFRESGYDIKVALNALLSTPAFWARENRGALVKSPVDLAVGTARTLGLREADGLPLAFVTRQLEQDLFHPPNVKGWPGGDVWINSKTLLGRKQFVDRLLRGEGMSETAREMVNVMTPNLPAPRRAMLLRDQFGAGSNRLDEDLRLRLVKAVDGLRVDGERWLAEVARYKLTPETVLLALPPSEVVAMDGTGLARIRSLMLDPVYQLK